MSWNYLQIETEGAVLRPTVGPGGMSRDAAHARVRTYLGLHAEQVPDTAVLLDAWDAGAPDDTVYVGSLLWCIYEADDPAAGARAWVDDLAASLRRTGSKVRIAW